MSPKTTLIISVYKNVPFLKAVLDSLAYQTRQDFEVIVSEDGESPEVRQFVSLYPFGVPFRHLTQKDAGWRKNRALNRAIIAARAEHLVFIDGDCVLHPRFMEAHIAHFRPDRVLAGLRVLLGESQSRALLGDSAYVLRLQKVVWKSLLFKNGIERPEEGLYIPWLHKLRKLDYLTGCNMSFSREAIMSINGFDEDYDKPAYGEDTDLVWRFKMAGLKFCSLRNLAVEYHLHHPRSWTDQSENMAKGLAKRQNKEYLCINGISKHLTSDEEVV